MNETNPDFITLNLLPGVLGVRGRFLLADAHLVDAPPLGVENLDGQAVHLEFFADRRHAAEVRQQIAADGLETFALDVRR